MSDIIENPKLFSLKGAIGKGNFASNVFLWLMTLGITSYLFFRFLFLELITTISWGMILFDIWYLYLCIILNGLFKRRIYDIVGKKGFLFYFLNIVIGLFLWIIIFYPLFIALTYSRVRLASILFIFILLILTTIFGLIPGKLIKKEKDSVEEYEGLIDKLTKLFNK